MTATIRMFASGDEPLKAQALLEEALRLDPSFADGYEALGVLLGRTGKFAEAIDIFKRLEEVAPNEPMVHTNLSLFYMKLGDKTAAEEEKASRRQGRRSPENSPGRKRRTKWPPRKPQSAKRTPSASARCSRKSWKSIPTIRWRSSDSATRCRRSAIGKARSACCRNRARFRPTIPPLFLARGKASQRNADTRGSRRGQSLPAKAWPWPRRRATLCRSKRWSGA